MTHPITELESVYIPHTPVSEAVITSCVSKAGLVQIVVQILHDENGQLFELDPPQVIALGLDRAEAIAQAILDVSERTRATVSAAGTAN